MTDKKFITVIRDTHPGAIVIAPGERKRDWMDNTGNKFAYRCLPLTIANQYGWDFLVPESFEATWNGNPDINAITIKSDSNNLNVSSRFGTGILTFNLEVIVKTDKDTNLMITGPINAGKNFIFPMSGILETDWMPYTFTMNYKFIVPNQTVRFEKGEPFCRIFPVPKNIDSYSFTIDLPENHPDLKNEERKWADARSKFMESAPTYNSKEWSENLPGFYYKGMYADGTKPDTDHKTRLSLDLTDNTDPCKVRIIENIASKEECEKIVNYVDEANLWEMANHDFWHNRVVNARTIAKYNKEIAELLISIRDRMKKQIIQRLDLKQEIYPDLLQVVKWPIGYSQPPHADAANLDGTDNGLSWRDFGSIVYLNDNFEGGETFYENFNLTIVPEAGNMIVHSGDILHAHGVKEIKGDIRYTIAVFWSFDPLRYDQLTKDNL